MKRANGTGCIYKQKGKLRKPYRVMITLGYADDGKAIRKTLGTFAKRKDAEEALIKYNHDPYDLDRDTITLGQCWEWMLEEKERKGVDLTKGGYRSITNHFKHLLNVPISSIKTPVLQAVVDECSKKLKYASLSFMKTYLGAAFNVAIKNDIVYKNYAKYIVLPKAEKSEIHKPFSIEDLAVLWANKDNLIVKLLLVYIYTGMRTIELYKMEVDNIDLKKRIMIGGVKTKAGKNRIIPIHDAIYNFVAELYSVAKFKKSTTLLEDERYPRIFRLACIRICKQLKITPHIPHDCRHTFVTLASESSMPEFELKKIIGHSQGNITGDIYTHTTVKRLLKAVNLLPNEEQVLKRVVNHSEKLGC